MASASASEQSDILPPIRDGGPSSKPAVRSAPASKEDSVGCACRSPTPDGSAARTCSPGLLTHEQACDSAAGRPCTQAGRTRTRDVRAGRPYTRAYTVEGRAVAYALHTPLCTRSAHAAA